MGVGARCLFFLALLVLASGQRTGGRRGRRGLPGSIEEVEFPPEEPTESRRGRGNSATSSVAVTTRRPSGPPVVEEEEEEPKGGDDRVVLPRGTLTPEEVFRLFNRRRPRNPSGPGEGTNVCGGPRQECCADDVCAPGLRCLLDGDDYWVGVEKRCMKPKDRRLCGVEGLRCCPNRGCLKGLTCAAGIMCRRPRAVITQPFRLRGDRQQSPAPRQRQEDRQRQPARQRQRNRREAAEEEPTFARSQTAADSLFGSDPATNDQAEEDMLAEEYAEAPAEAPDTDPNAIVGHSASFLTGWLKISVKAEGGKCYVSIDTFIDTSTETFGEGTFSETFGDLEGTGECEDDAEGYAIGFIRAEVLATAAVEADGDCFAESTAEVEAESQVFGTGITIDLSGDAFGDAGCFKRRLRELLDPGMSYPGEDVL